MNWDFYDNAEADFETLLEAVSLVRGYTLRLSPFGLVTFKLGITAGTVSDDGLAVAIYMTR